MYMPQGSDRTERRNEFSSVLAFQRHCMFTATLSVHVVVVVVVSDRCAHRRDPITTETEVREFYSTNDVIINSTASNATIATVQIKMTAAAHVSIQQDFLYRYRRVVYIYAGLIEPAESGPGPSQLLADPETAGLGPRQSDTRWSKRDESDKSLSRLGRITVEKFLPDDEDDEEVRSAMNECEKLFVWFTASAELAETRYWLRDGSEQTRAEEEENQYLLHL
ncbi:hypothetical protein DAPPUDRAFT_245169 [Daphnia pulex]|uniref:Uncharacterized protein n=1 Tax=Daphnia pulex TaxID=6669 RepID=E9GMQ7_DAPPU|nr:hypothetical protein DAPPUDRAFT_245169 [Daphnia pulex]|eukprot:EFX79138.1 hypothetical protein DAPPUDRAFT_245169 [Daphnia pulex]